MPVVTGHLQRPTDAAPAGTPTLRGAPPTPPGLCWLLPNPGPHLGSTTSPHGVRAEVTTLVSPNLPCPLIPAMAPPPPSRCLHPRTTQTFTTCAQRLRGAARTGPAHVQGSCCRQLSPMHKAACLRAHSLLPISPRTPPVQPRSPLPSLFTRSPVTAADLDPRGHPTVTP